MSFGFSVGDIILCTQIAHRLFSSVTDGRKNAPRDLKELEDALFGLYCALDHLQHEHDAILTNTTSKPGNGAVQYLGLMINSCRTTLEQLDNATAKYREAADDRLHAPPFAQGIDGLRNQVKIQLRRVMWDMRGDSLTKYRQKLQAHTDSINLLLISSIWSSTNRIKENGDLHQKRLDAILEQASQVISLQPNGAEKVNLSQPRVPPAPSVWPNGQFLRLPESIHTINEARKVIGEKEFEVRRRQLDAESPASTQQPHKRRPLPASKGVDSVQQLGRRVEHIFQTLNVPEASRITTNHDLQTDIVAWVSSLGNVLEQLQASPPVYDKQELNIIVSELAELLVRLNLLLEESEVRNRGVFYDASGSHIDRVFTKLRSLSTVCEKEIEEFEDEREDWGDS